MAKSKQDYFGINKIISAILCLLFGFLLGIIVRFLEGKPVAGLVRLLSCCIGVGFLMNIIDFVLILVNGRILRVIDK